jgi:hypothetical protein
MKRVHITGCPRSGTTLMMELMRSCFECDSFCDHEESIFVQPPIDSKLHFSKQPTDVLYLNPLLQADERLYSISMIRDPRSVICSEHKNYPGMYFCNFRVWNDCYQSSKELEKHAHALSVQYEELVHAPDEAQDRIQRRFPFLKKLRKFSEYHQFGKPSDNATSALGGVRNISSERIRTWINHLPRVKHELKQHPELAEILIREEYEKNEDWIEMLSDVSTNKGQCRYPDKEKPSKKVMRTFRKHIKTRRYIKSLAHDSSRLNRNL